MYIYFFFHGIRRLHKPNKAMGNGRIPSIHENVFDTNDLLQVESVAGGTFLPKALSFCFCFLRNN